MKSQTTNQQQLSELLRQIIGPELMTHTNIRSNMTTSITFANGDNSLTAFITDQALTIDITLFGQYYDREYPLSEPTIITKTRQDIKRFLKPDCHYEKDTADDYDDACPNC